MYKNSYATSKLEIHIIGVHICTQISVTLIIFYAYTTRQQVPTLSGTLSCTKTMTKAVIQVTRRTYRKEMAVLKYSGFSCVATPLARRKLPSLGCSGRSEAWESEEQFLQDTFVLFCDVLKKSTYINKFNVNVSLQFSKRKLHQYV